MCCVEGDKVFVLGVTEGYMETNVEPKYYLDVSYAKSSHENLSSSHQTNDATTIIFLFTVTIACSCCGCRLAR